MFIERLLNQGDAPMLEQWLHFTAARHWLIAENVVNVNTTRNARGERIPYRRRLVTFAPEMLGDSSRPGVHVDQVTLDPGAVPEAVVTGHPHADASGYVQFPNIDVAVEYVNALGHRGRTKRT